MNTAPADPDYEQPTDIETAAARTLLDQLLTDAQLYTSSQDYLALLDFVVRLRNFAPFNALLLQIQKPGLRFAASARDWRDRFGRWPREGVRPLLILWPFGPMALVYDVQDTEGRELPADVETFFARGPIEARKMAAFIPLVAKKGIRWCWLDAGDASAGYVRLLQRTSKDKSVPRYLVGINSNHPPPTQFATLAHELGHLYLGHLGPDRELNIPQRPALTHGQKELEAESVTYLLCARNGVKCKSETYLAHYVKANSTVADLDLYQVMRAAGNVEGLLRLTAHTKYDPPPPVPALEQGWLPLARARNPA